MSPVHTLFFNKILGILFQTTCNQSPRRPFSHIFLSWYLIIALGLDFLSVSDMVVEAVCHLFQHNSPSNIFIASCLWQQIILDIISCFRMFSHHNLILQIITQYLTCLFTMFPFTPLPLFLIWFTIFFGDGHLC
jgi:hypothetical protein